MGRPRLDPAVRWWSKVDKRGPDECWPWTGSRSPQGYGRIDLRIDGVHKSFLAHRFGFVLLVGPIPDGHFVCHHCDNPPCCNPAHWFCGPRQANVDDMMAKGRNLKVWGEALNRSRRTHCKRGHAFTPENTYVRPRSGHRECRQCSR